MCSYKEINEWFKWKNTPVKDRKLQSVEEKFNDYTKICGGDNETDVLYNILYLYAIGLYIKTRSEPNMEYFVSNRIQSGRQYLHSLKYINSHRDPDIVLSFKLDAPSPCRLDAPDLDLICYASADCLHQHLQVI